MTKVTPPMLEKRRAISARVTPMRPMPVNRGPMELLFCLRCRAPQTDDSAKMTKRFFDNVKIRKRILATAATGANKPIEALLTSDLRHMGEGSKKRGQMSAEAATIRDAKDRRQRAAKLSYPARQLPSASTRTTSLRRG